MQGGGLLLPREVYEQAVKAWIRAQGSRKLAATALGIPLSTFKHRIERAKKLGIKLPPLTRNSATKGYAETIQEAAGTEVAFTMKTLEKTIKTLKAENFSLQNKILTEHVVRKIIHGIEEEEVIPRKWAAKAPHKGTLTGSPLLFASDWHFDEVVPAAAVNHVNAFNRKIANARIERLFEKTIELLFHHMAHPNYPYLTLVFGGDLINGIIHEELAQTNEAPVMVSLLALMEHVVAGIKYLRENGFPRIRIFCIVGNHGRIHMKPRYKNRQFENFEWLFYQFLKKEFKDDTDIEFTIAEGSDLLFKVYNTTYLLTHGDQFRGGSGISAELAPLMIGDARKRKRQMAVGQPYDFMIMGHWHTYIHLKKLIVNGSIKGYDEFAFEHNFDYDVPIQALWITHPDWGITARWPIYLEKPGTIW